MTCEWVLSGPIIESRRLRDRADGRGQGGTNNSSTSSARHFRGLSLPSQNHLQAHEQSGQSGLGETLSESEKIGQTETRRVVRAVTTPDNRHARRDCSPLAAMFRVACENEVTALSFHPQPIVRPKAASDCVHPRPCLNPRGQSAVASPFGLGGAPRESFQIRPVATGGRLECCHPSAQDARRFLVLRPKIEAKKTGSATNQVRNNSVRHQ